jgi:hypothetical protein
MGVVLGLLAAAPGAASAADPPCCGPISADGRKLQDFLDHSGVEHLWRARVHVVWWSGEPDPARPGAAPRATHCSAFAAAVADRLGVYLLRPPAHRQTLLANAQARWLASPQATGWQAVSAGQAQALANQGWLVLATYLNPDPHRPGHIAVLRPSLESQAVLELDGPAETQAGWHNYLRTSVAHGFASHPGAWRNGEIRFFAHPVDWQHVRAAAGAKPGQRPVKVVADARMLLTPGGVRAEEPLFLSRDWTGPLPGVKQALVIVHGVGRDADAYYATGLGAVAAAGGTAKDTIVIAPQFLNARDVAAHHLPAATLRWVDNSWMAGENALAPAPLSSYAVLDAIIARLADRARFPDLQDVVIAGHSGGGQMVQRYAVLGHAAAAPPSGLQLRFVVANPSSYLWFTDDRPDGQGGFAPFPAASCPGFDHWKYGLVGLPPYARGVVAGQLAHAYAARSVTYLLGTADTDPNQPALDRSCMGEAQGPTRLARGLAYFRYLRANEPAAMAHQSLYLVPGVGHSAGKMFLSACGLSALFGVPGCAPASP